MTTKGYGDRIDAVVNGCTNFVPADWVRLALAALDQAGISADALKRATTHASHSKATDTTEVVVKALAMDRDFDAYLPACFFCGNEWGKCLCRWDNPDECGRMPENAKGFDTGDFFITQPNVSECTRYFVDPVRYYGAAYVEAAARFGWKQGEAVNPKTPEVKP